MKTHRFFWLAVVFTFALQVLLFGVARAQDQDDDEDPPSRVARLNYSSGSVSFQPGGEGEWVTAVGNRPLTTGDNLWADQGSRAEFHVGSLAVRMNSQTSVTFLDLDDRTTQLRLSMGSVILRVRHLDDGELLEVDTPNVAFTIQRTGEYRVDVNEDGTRTITTVWHGRAEATGGGYSYTVVAGQEATFTGTDQIDHEIAQIHPSDDFDNFAFQRDARDDHDESSNYISSEMTGYEDLDDYGRWHYVADYGPVWSPNGVAADWAPYRYGHWAWVAPWGWTWVEDEPWGFAPFHYGRWAFVDSSWCWVPGPVVVRPIYAPALVAFVGGGGFQLSVGVGEGVAWFPLGPREVYVPPYRVSRRYVDNVNVTNTRVNVTQVTNVYNTYITNNTNVNRITYVNQRLPRAVTAVSRDTFVNARPVNRNLAQVNARDLEQAPITHQVAAQPDRQSVIGAGAPARVKPPAAVENRRVIATRNPTPPRAPLEQRHQQAAANVKTEPMRPNAPAEPTRGNNAARPGEPGDNTRGNESARPNEPARPNQPAHTNEPPRPNAPNRANEPARPNEPARGNEPSSDASRSNPPEPPNGPAHPNPPTKVPRPNAPATRPEPPDRGAQPASPEPPRPEQNAPRPNAPDRQHEQQPERPQSNRQDVPRPQHPLVRQAPPVQQREQTEQSEANKFRTWQQQRPPRPQQPERQAQPERPQQQRQNPPRPRENQPQRDQHQDKKPQ